MNQVTIDGTEYSIEVLSDTAQQLINNIAFVDAEIQRMQNLIAVHNAARVTYYEGLKRELPGQSQ